MDCKKKRNRSIGIDYLDECEEFNHLEEIWMVNGKIRVKCWFDTLSPSNQVNISTWNL